MTIKSRIILLGIQLLILSLATLYVTGKLAVNEIWYFSGLLAIIINPLLLEPWYPKSYDTLANSIIAVLLSLVITSNIAIVGWTFLRIFLGLLIFISIIQLIHNSKKEKEDNVRLKALFPLFKLGKATIIYSLVFWLAVIELYQTTDNNFWILGGCWALLTFTRFINWEDYFLAITDKPVPVSPIGIIGPSNLIITSKSLNNVGTRVIICSGNLKEKGIIVKKIYRTDDVWGQIQLDSDSEIGYLVSRQQLTIEIDKDHIKNEFLGNVNEGTNTSLVVFDSFSKVQIGDTIYLSNDGEIVFYQIVQAEVIKLIIKSGSQLDRRIKAIQIGTYRINSQSLHINKSLPSLSEPIFRAINNVSLIEKIHPIANKFTIGKIQNCLLTLIC